MKPKKKSASQRGTPLSVSHPDLAAQWHPTKNGEHTPAAVVAGTKRKFWWKCPAEPDHEWQAQPQARTRHSGCPFCGGKRASVTNSLASQHPELAAQWHPTKNGDLTPKDIVAGSSKKVWWTCDKGPDHEWQATPVDRTRRGKPECPFCAGRKVSVTNSLASLHPELTAQWHPTRNGDLSPENVVAGSKKNVWWLCDKGPDHEWQATVQRRSTRGTGCPSSPW